MNIDEKAKSELPNYKEVIEKINQRQKEFGDDFTEYRDAQLRRELKKLIMHPAVEKVGFLIGAEIKNWGAIMRKKYGEFYPEGDRRAGELIPEVDMDYTYFIYTSDGMVGEFKTKEDYTEHICNKINFKTQEAKKNILAINTAEKTPDITNFEIKGVLKVTLKGVEESLPIGTIQDYRGAPLVRMDNLNVLELRLSDNRAIVTVDDNSSEHSENFMTVFMDKSLLNFTDDAMGLTMFGFVNKNDSGAVNMNCIGVLVKDERFRLSEKPEPLEDKEEEVNVFL